MKHVSTRVLTKILKFPRNYAYYNSLASFRLSVRFSLYQSSNRIYPCHTLIESIPSPRPIRAKYSNIRTIYFSLLDHSLQIPAEYSPWRNDRTQRGISLSHRLTRAKIIQWVGCVGGTLAKGWAEKRGVKRRGNYYHWNLWWHRDYPFSVFTAAQLQETIITLARVSCFAIPLSRRTHSSLGETHKSASLPWLHTSRRVRVEFCRDKKKKTGIERYKWTR